MKNILIILIVLSASIYLNPYDQPVSPYDKPANPYGERYCDNGGKVAQCNYKQ